MLIYRDRKTGRFVRKSTWTRSKAQGGTRYVRQKVERRRVAPSPVPEIEPIEIAPPEQLEPEEAAEFELEIDIGEDESTPEAA